MLPSRRRAGLGACWPGDGGVGVGEQGREVLMLSMLLRQQVTDRAPHDWILQDDRVAVPRVALARQVFPAVCGPSNVLAAKSAPRPAITR